jgi:hypothetical protein
MDEFKKYLFEHRDELDTEKPPRPQVWQHIDRQTRIVKKPVISLMAKWMAAAAILAATMVLIDWLQRPANTAPPQTVAETPKTTNNPEPTGQADSSNGTASVIPNEEKINALPGDKTTKETASAPLARKEHKKNRSLEKAIPLSPLQAIEDNYATIISYQLKKVERTPIYTESAGYFHVFKKQWYDLERDEKKVKQDVRMYGLDDNVVNQLIQLYQQKLWLLKELQSEINKMNIKAKQHPDIQRNNPAYLKL